MHVGVQPGTVHQMLGELLCIPEFLESVCFRKTIGRDNCQVVPLYIRGSDNRNDTATQYAFVTAQTHAYLIVQHHLCQKLNKIVIDFS